MLQLQCLDRTAGYQGSDDDDCDDDCDDDHDEGGDESDDYDDGAMVMPCLDWTPGYLDFGPIRSCTGLISLDSSYHITHSYATSKSK